jgi:chromate reductase, NAD(P)H dehydrogenase (quinone)
MITVISGTNRADSMTMRIASLYYDLLLEKSTEKVQLFSLEGRQVWERGEEMIALEQQYLVPAQKFVIIMPEYNASFPGILKLMMDNSDIKKCWWYKKAALVGVSDGRAGNLRGIEHMTAILHYLKVNVLYNKLLLSQINQEMDNSGVLMKPKTAAAINEQVEDILKF